MSDENALCPGCSRGIKWDWCQDEYVVEDKAIVHGEHNVFRNNKHILINTQYCPFCNTVLVMYSNDLPDLKLPKVEDDQVYLHHPMLRQYNWEAKINSI